MHTKFTIGYLLILINVCRTEQDKSIISVGYNYSSSFLFFKIFEDFKQNLLLVLKVALYCLVASWNFSNRFCV